VKEGRRLLGTVADDAVASFVFVAVEEFIGFDDALFE